MIPQARNYGLPAARAPARRLPWIVALPIALALSALLWCGIISLIWCVLG